MHQPRRGWKKATSQEAFQGRLRLRRRCGIVAGGAAYAHGVRNVPKLHVLFAFHFL